VYSLGAEAANRLPLRAFSRAPPKQYSDPSLITHHPRASCPVNPHAYAKGSWYTPKRMFATQDYSIEASASRLLLALKRVRFPSANPKNRAPSKRTDTRSSVVVVAVGKTSCSARAICD
jgi:hypothetical protein